MTFGILGIFHFHYKNHNKRERKILILHFNLLSKKKKECSNSTEWNVENFKVNF
jgi:hypothetical protein